MNYRAEHTFYRFNFPYGTSGSQKRAFFVHSTTRYAAYIHPRLDLILTVPDFPK